MIFTITLVLIAVLGLLIGKKQGKKFLLYVGMSAALYVLFEIVLFVFSYKFNTPVRCMITCAFLIIFGVSLIVSNVKQVGLVFAVVASSILLLCLFFLSVSNTVVKEYCGRFYEGRCDGLSGVTPMTVYYYEKKGPFTSARPDFRDDYSHSFSDFDILVNEEPMFRVWYSEEIVPEDVQWQNLYIGGMPAVTEYEVGKCSELCTDGLLVWKRALGENLYVCWSESDMNGSDLFEKYDATSSMKITHNIDFNKCGEYEVTVSEGELSCSFKVKVVENDGSPVKTEEEAVALAKRYVYAEYGKSFYQSSDGVYKYRITTEKGVGTWVVSWSPDVEWEGMMVMGGGGPLVTIDAENGKVLSCGLQQ